VIGQDMAIVRPDEHVHPQPLRRSQERLGAVGGGGDEEEDPGPIGGAMQWGRSRVEHAVRLACAVRSDWVSKPRCRLRNRHSRSLVTLVPVMRTFMRAHFPSLR
jgi:hypothetical protein